ncbi:MAG: 7-cyano-7-deazaguanine synthase QueC [Phycisphaerales bacterium]
MSPPPSTSPARPAASPSAPKPVAVVLLSGGLDSAVALACAKRDGFDPVAISFDYGQRHHVELAAAARVAAALGIARHLTLKVDLRAIGGSALTDAAINVPKDAVGQPSDLPSAVPITYVPARNLIFISLAAGLAETVGASDIYLGVNAVDYSGYPDCREAFLRSLEATLALGTRAGVETGANHRPWRLHAPLVHLSKAAIIRLGADLHVPLELTHSCYDPRGSLASPHACGHCDSCLIRQRGFIEAAVSDPTVYAA